MKIKKVNKMDGNIYPIETVFVLEGLEEKDKELDFYEIKDFILKNASKINSLSVKSKYFRYEDLELCLIFNNFEYSSNLLSISKSNEEIEIKKGTRIIKFPEILNAEYFPFVEEEEIEIFEIIQFIDNNLIIKKEENFIEFSYNDNLVLASNNFVVRATKNKESNGKFQIYDFKFNKNFKPFEIKKKLDISNYDFSVSNEKNELYVMFKDKQYFLLHSKNNFKNNFRSFISQFSLNFPLKKFENFEINAVERFGVNPYSSFGIETSFGISINLLEKFQYFVSENSKKMLQEQIEILKKQIQK